MAKECTGLSPTALEWCEGKVNLPGIKRTVYFIPKRDIVSWPTKKEAFTTSMAELATLEGSFTLAAEKNWNRLDVIVDRSSVTFEPQGTKPSKTFLNKATFVHPGVEEEATAFCTLANNDDYVYIIETKPGKFRIFGNDMYQTSTSPTMDLGSEPTSEMGTTIEVEITDAIPAPFYIGEIVTADGTINED